MKVIEGCTGYQPVTIVIETEKEHIAIKQALELGYESDELNISEDKVVCALVKELGGFE